MDRRVIILSVAAATALLTDPNLDRSTLLEGDDLFPPEPELGPPRLDPRAHVQEYHLKEDRPMPAFPRVHLDRERTHPTSPKQRGGRGGRW